MKSKYKIQYFNAQHQLVESDWTDIDVPIKEEVITSVWFQEELIQEQYKEFMKQFDITECAETPRQVWNRLKRK